MNLILFDLGGTLIDDPFTDVLKKLQQECLKAPESVHLRGDCITNLFNYWRKENFKKDFAFASHFLQEESWLTSSLMLLNSSKGIPHLADLPLTSVTLLKRYRELAQVHISSQTQLPSLRKTLKILKMEGAIIGVASNDREFATRAMLTWANLFKYFDWVFSSEHLSEKYRGAQKPNLEFFQAIFSEIGKPIEEWNHVIYVGDSESNDILPARRMGFQTIRYVNKLNPRNSVWTDATMTTVADYRYSDRGQSLKAIRSAIGR
jgi:FMN phosphatase YigB (HAD superfamily)